MDDARNLLIFGASTRAAAFSALRAGLRPWCADLFADRDLRARRPVVRLRAGEYPQRFAELIRSDLPGSWIFTGGLENRESLVSRMARRRELWGNEGFALRAVRDPVRVARLVRDAGLPTPTTAEEPPRSAARRWLLKNRRGTGGRGIRFWDGRLTAPEVADAPYWQEHVEGEACAAVYVGDGERARLLGATRQLTGVSWLHAEPFHYCGSVGPLRPEPRLLDALTRLGDVLVAGCGLRGLFGVDGVLNGGGFWPVEVNPRYTASVEVLEYATDVQALAWHRAAFDESAPRAAFPSPPANARVVGKAVLFAPAELVFPEDGPWLSELDPPRPVTELPEFADIPLPGERIEKGRPVLTFFARAASQRECEDTLRRRAEELTRLLFPTMKPA